MLLASRNTALPVASCRQRSPSRCCHSPTWAGMVVARMPFASEKEIQAAMDEAFLHLSRSDLLEAIGAHPPIGDKNALREKFAASGSGSSWEGEEQAGTRGASESTLDELAKLNQAYRDKHGYVFLVCATGKSAGEMLAILKDRLPNERALELAIAGQELLKIAHLRFGRILEERTAATAAAAAVRATGEASAGGEGGRRHNSGRSRL